MQADAADSKGAAQLGDPSKFELVSPNGPSEGPATAVFVYGLSEIMTSGYNGITMATGEKVFKITTCPPWVGYAGDTLPLGYQTGQGTQELTRNPNPNPHQAM